MTAITCQNCGHQNAEGATFCTNCGFSLDWASADEPEPGPSLRESPPPPEREDVDVTKVLPPTRAAVSLELSPATARLPPGEWTWVDVLLRDERGTSAVWSLEVGGDAAPWAQLEAPTVSVPAHGAAQVRIAVQVPPGLGPGRAGYRVTARGPASAREASAEGVVDVLAGAPLAAARPPRGTRWKVIAVVVLVVLGILAIVAVVKLAPSVGVGGGVEATIRDGSGATLRASPNGQNVGGLGPGTEVEIDCQVTVGGGKWDKLSSPDEANGRFVFDGLVERSEDPETC